MVRNDDGPGAKTRGDVNGSTSDSAATPARRRRRLAGSTPRARLVVLATGILALGITSFGVAATGDALLQGKRNGTTTAETEVISNINAGTGLKGGYSTRQSNLSSTGGGAIYGCRSTAGGSAATPPTEPCVRANNLATGFAFEFNATNGAVAGLITAGTGGDAKKPFTTNATGVATGLNADRVDGLEGKAITDAIAAAVSDATAKANAAKERWVRIGENAAGDGAVILAQSGGFTLVNCYQANGNCYIDAGSDVTDNAISSEILTDNVENPGPDGAEQLSGTSSSSPCFLASVACGPAGTDSTNGGSNGVFVVTPRNVDGTVPAAGDRYSFTATVSAAESAG